MSIGGYKIRNKEEIHFITFAVVEWVDVFTRKQYRDIVIDSLRPAQGAIGKRQMDYWKFSCCSANIRHGREPSPFPLQTLTISQHT